MIIVTDTLPETNIALENRVSQKETIVFQPTIFRGELLVSGGYIVEGGPKFSNFSPRFWEEELCFTQLNPQRKRLF